MNRTTLATLLLATASLAQSPIADFDYDSDTLSTAQPSFATVSDLSVSNSYIWGGPSSNRWLCLTTDWNDVGGTLSFTVTPNAGESILYSSLVWSSDTNNTSLSDSVASVEVFANGVLVGAVNPIVHETVNTIDLSGFPALQGASGAVTFELVFAGNPTGESSYESAYMRLYGEVCELDIDDVTPHKLEVVTPDCFTVTGDCFDLVTGVCFGTHVLPVQTPGDFGGGSWKLVDNHTIEVCPPQCLPPGSYDIKLTRDNGEQETDSVLLEQPVENKIACPLNHPAGQPMCVAVSAGTSQPAHNVIFIVLSGSNVPSIIPGLVELGLGNMFADYLCGPGYVAECAIECYDIPLAMAGTDFYFQSVVWSYVTPTVPAFPTTNLCGVSFF